MSLAGPGHDVAEAAFIGLVPLCLALRRAGTPRRAAALGGLAGVVYFAIVAAPFTTLGWWGWARTPAEFQAGLRQQDLFFRIWHPLTALGCGATWALWAGARERFARGPVARVWLGAALWLLLCEWLRSRIFFDYEWGAAGLMLHPFPRLRAIAAATGVAGLSALVVLANGAIAEVLGAWLERGRGGTQVAPRGARPRSVVLAAASVVVAFAGARIGAAWLSERAVSASEERTLRVAVLQGGERAYRPDELERFTIDPTYASFFGPALAQRAKLLVLPEAVGLAKLSLDRTGVAGAFERSVDPAEVGRFLAPWLAPSGATAVVGFDAILAGRVRNGIGAWSAASATHAELSGLYAKRRLTPFAEYPPLGFGRLAPEGRLVIEAGQGAQNLSVAGVELGFLICQEIGFARLTRESVRAGAELIAANGNDGIFRSPVVARGHHIAAELRAVEIARPIVRATKTGISSILDARGLPAARSREGEQIALVADVRPSRWISPYVRFGDWVTALAALVVGGVVAADLRGRRSLRAW